MATMRDVAARAGVSAKTVSRVFNDDPHVLPATRAQVEKVMRELNYVPNNLATTFRSGRTLAIGVAVPDIVDPFFASIARSVDEVARQHRMSSLVTSLGDDPESERATLETLLGRQLSGLVVAPVGTDHSWLARWQEHTPIVFVDRAPIGITADTFTEDDEVGAFLATDHLLSHGHKRIAYIGDIVHLSTELKRIEGWRRALLSSGVDPHESLIADYVSDAASARAAVSRLLLLPDPPTALFSANARTTMALVSVLRDNPIPIVGFGDFPMSEVVIPSVTVIDQDPAKLGALAAHRVLERLANPAKRLKKINVMDVSLVERESCLDHR